MIYMFSPSHTPPHTESAIGKKETERENILKIKEGRKGGGNEGRKEGAKKEGKMRKNERNKETSTGVRDRLHGGLLRIKHVYF